MADSELLKLNSNQEGLHHNLLVLGFANSGVSSLVNSIATALQPANRNGLVKTLSKAAPPSIKPSAGRTTTCISKFNMAQHCPGLRLNVWESYGLATGAIHADTYSSYSSPLELDLLLQGMLNDRFTAPKDAKTLTQVISQAKSPDRQNVIHSVAFVIPQAIVTNLAGPELGKIKSILQQIRSRNREPVIVLTKLDLIVGGIDETGDGLAFEQSPVVTDIRRITASLLEVPINNIRCVVNYNCPAHERLAKRSAQIDKLVVSVVKQLVEQAKSFEGCDPSTVALTKKQPSGFNVAAANSQPSSVEAITRSAELTKKIDELAKGSIPLPQSTVKDGPLPPPPLPKESLDKIDLNDLKDKHESSINSCSTNSSLDRIVMPSSGGLLLSNIIAQATKSEPPKSSTAVNEINGTDERVNSSQSIVTDDIGKLKFDKLQRDNDKALNDNQIPRAAETFDAVSVGTAPSGSDAINSSAAITQRQPEEKEPNQEAIVKSLAADKQQYQANGISVDSIKDVILSGRDACKAVSTSSLSKERDKKSESVPDKDKGSSKAPAESLPSDTNKSNFGFVISTKSKSSIDNLATPTDINRDLEGATNGQSKPSVGNSSIMESKKTEAAQNGNIVKEEAVSNLKGPLSPSKQVAGKEVQTIETKPSSSTSNLKIDIDQFATKVQLMKATDDVRNELIKAQSNIAEELGGNIGSVDKALNALSVNVKGISASIQALNKTVDEQQKSIDSWESKLSEITSSAAAGLQKLSPKLEELGKQIEALETSNSRAEIMNRTEFNLLRSRLDKLQNEIGLVCCVISYCDCTFLPFESHVVLI